MSDEIFKEGGPLNIKKVDPDHVTMEIRFPPGSDGRVARACPNEACCPGYFKVKSGTGITKGQDQAYCPYCGFSDEPAAFITHEQRKYMEGLVIAEALGGIEQIFENSFNKGTSHMSGAGGIELHYKRGPKPIVPHPFEEDVRRDVICPNCGLDHSVFGLAIWCADCGKDIFLTHIEAEFAVLRLMLSDNGRRRALLGNRAAAKDIENYLEDTVSIFEAVLRQEARRLMHLQGVEKEEIEINMKKIGNAFQNIGRSETIFENEFGITLLANLSEAESASLKNTFEKRHPIAHNLGIMDRKYLDRARAAEKEGHDVLVTDKEIEHAIVLSLRIFRSAHSIESVPQKDKK